MTNDVLESLRVCAAEGPCTKCHERIRRKCIANLTRKAADVIENLQTKNAALRRQIDNLTSSNAVIVKEFDKKLEELAEVKAERSWISVKDRLPECNGTFLVVENYCGGAFITTVMYTPKYDGFDKHLRGKAMWYDYDRECGDYEKTDITYWMPLPEPPEKEM